METSFVSALTAQMPLGTGVGRGPASIGAGARRFGATTRVRREEASRTAWKFVREPERADAA